MDVKSNLSYTRVVFAGRIASPTQRSIVNWPLIIPCISIIAAILGAFLSVSKDSKLIRTSLFVVLLVVLVISAVLIRDKGAGSSKNNSPTNDSITNQTNPPRPTDNHNSAPKLKKTEIKKPIDPPKNSDPPGTVPSQDNPPQVATKPATDLTSSATQAVPAVSDEDNAKGCSEGPLLSVSGVRVEAIKGGFNMTMALRTSDPNGVSVLGTGRDPFSSLTPSGGKELRTNDGIDQEGKFTFWSGVTPAAWEGAYPRGLIVSPGKKNSFHNTFSENTFDPATTATVGANLIYLYKAANGEPKTQKVSITCQDVVIRRPHQ